MNIVLVVGFILLVGFFFYNVIKQGVVVLMEMVQCEFQEDGVDYVRIVVFCFELIVMQIYNFECNCLIK